MNEFANEAALRKQICRIGRLMRRFGYIDGGSGNISARLDANHVLTTPSGLAKGFMKPEQLIIVNLDGEKVGTPTRANRDLRPTSETPMHLECYRQRADIGGVVHAHPPTAVALTVAGVSLERCFLPEAIIVLGLVPTAPYSTPAGPEDRDAIHDLIKTHDALMLSNHGSLTVGPDVWTAYMRLEVLEHYANILYRVVQLRSDVPSLPEHKVTELLELRRKSGYLHPEDPELFHNFYAAMRPNTAQN